MIAISEKLNENSINFNSNSLVSNSSDWSIVDGTATLGSTILLDTQSSIKVNLANINSNYTYLKLVCRVDNDDQTLLTNSIHKVAVIYRIKYTNSNIRDTVNIFYPNFIYEDGAVSYVIIQTSDYDIASISINIINSEDITIKILETALYYAVVAKSSNIDQVMYDYITNNTEAFDQAFEYYINECPEHLDNLIADYLAENPQKVILPLYTSSDLPNVVDGEMFRMDTV